MTILLLTASAKIATKGANMQKTTKILIALTVILLVSLGAFIGLSK